MAAPDPHQAEKDPKDPASEAQKHPDQQHNPLRRTAENLPPPIFILLFLLFSLYILFTSSLSSPEPSVVPDIKSSLASTPIPKVNPDSSSSNFTMSSAEQTFIAIKPDGVQRGLIGPIISRFENRGFKLAAIKLTTPGKEHLEAHYADLKDKPFFAGLVEYMNSGPICAMVWEGRDAVKTGRTILGATNPLASAPGTIRGDFAIDVGRNVCHGSDSVENAKKEISLWFKEGEVVSYKSSQFDWIYEKA
ncbi:Fc.00g049050.m01.CDS01 [Cosmosporella sp. VM-42]